MSEPKIDMTIVDSVEKLEVRLKEVKAAQEEFSHFTQEQVDKIFKAAAIAANSARIPLAQMAVEETGMGVMEDKVIKNNYAAEYIYNKSKNTKTCGVIEQDDSFGVDARRPEDPQRYHHQPASPCQEVHHCGC